MVSGTRDNPAFELPARANFSLKSLKDSTDSRRVVSGSEKTRPSRVVSSRQVGSDPGWRANFFSHRGLLLAYPGQLTARQVSRIFEISGFKAQIYVTKAE